METHRFIAQDPIGPRYSRRIPDIEWEDQKPFLEELHRQKLTREQMVKELAQQRNFHVKKNRLDSRMNAWGLSRYKRAEIHLSPSRGHGTQIAQASSNDELNDEATSAHDTHDEGTDGAFQHRPTLGNNGESSILGPCDGEASAVEPLSATPGRSSITQMHDIINVSTDAVDGYNQKNVTASPESSQVKSLNYAQDYEKARCWIRGLLPVGLNEVGSFGAIKLQRYDYSRRMVALCEVIGKRTWKDVDSSQLLAAFCEAGAFLRGLKVYEMAFEFSLIVVRCLNVALLFDRKYRQGWIIAILKCARYANTSQQVLVARHAVDSLLSSAKSNELQFQFPLGWCPVEESLPQSIRSYLKYLQHSDLSGIGQSNEVSSDFDVPFQVVLDLDICRVNNFLRWEAAAGDRNEHQIFEHLQSCPIATASMLGALRAFKNLLRERAVFIDVVVGTRWLVPDRAAGLHIARLLSCLLLHDYRPVLPAEGASDTHELDHECQEVSCALGEPALLAWPFTIIDWVRRDPGSSITMHLRPSQSLLAAAIDIEHSIVAKEYFCKDSLVRCLVSIGGDNMARKSEVDPALSDWVFDIASAAANLNATPDFSWLEPFVPIHPPTSLHEAWLDRLRSRDAGEGLAADQSLDGDQNPDARVKPLHSTDAMDVTLSAAMLRWSMSDVSSTRSFRKFSERIKYSLTFNRSKQTRSSDAMSLDSRASSKLSLFAGIANLSPRSSLQKSDLPSFYEETPEDIEPVSDDKTFERSGSTRMSPGAVISSPVLISTTNWRQTDFRPELYYDLTTSQR